MLSIGLLYPDLLGTYGDGGNATVLAARARARQIPVDIVAVRSGDELIDADLYLVGGGEDGPQRQATELLRATSFTRRVDDGAVVFAVCAGLQILGESFAVEGDESYEGLGCVSAVTTRGPQRRVGEMATTVGTHTLVGFENHGGLTTLGAEVAPLGTVVAGYGNDGVVDGYQWRNILATYAHGPALALNPWLADLLLEKALGHEVAPLPTVADALYRERVAALLAN